MPLDGPDYSPITRKPATHVYEVDERTDELMRIAFDREEQKPVEVPMSAVEKVLTAIVTGIVGWATWVTKRLLTGPQHYMSKEEHAQICETHQEETKAALTMIEKRLDENHKDSTAYREKVQQELATQSANIAVLLDRSDPTKQQPRRRR